MARRAHYERVERLERLKPPSSEATVAEEEFWAAVDDLLEALLAATDDEWDALLAPATEDERDTITDALLCRAAGPARDRILCRRSGAVPVAEHPAPPGPGWLSDGRYWYPNMAR